MTAGIDAGALSYGAGVLLFGLLTLLLLTAWRGRLTGGLLLSAVGTSVIWCAVLASHSWWGWPPFAATLFVETVRGAAWLLFLLSLLGLAKRSAGRRMLPAGTTFTAALLLCVGLAGANLLTTFLRIPGLTADAAGRALLFGHILLAVAGLALVEQLYRNTRPEHRWSVKLLCVGVGGMFVYDFYMYADALLLNRVQSDVWAARGVVNAMLVPLIAVAAARNPEWSLEVFVSRHVVFHSAALLGAGVYLMLMAGAGYYIRSYGGSWGSIAQTVFLFGALVLLALLLFSGQVRSRIRVFVSKHFFRNKYDYREEWLRFTHALSRSSEGDDLRRNIVRAIADIMESPGGLLWMRRESGSFHVASSDGANLPETEAVVVPRDAPLPRFMERTGWVVYVDEYRELPEKYRDMSMPRWVDAVPRAWLVVPLMQGETLTGFLLLLRSETKHDLNWEDSDLLKTVGRQAASYLAMLQLTEALADARQFDAFNRLSAYVVHDLKNLVAQLSLVVSNSKRHMHSPGFLEDAFGTVDNATAKMNRLLAQLRKGKVESGPSRRVDLAHLLQQVVQARADARPLPVLDDAEPALEVEAEPERLAAVLEHLVQNAQEATPDDGEIHVSLRREDAAAVVEIIDTGCGMDSRFIADRLFRPFDTTKGNAGMGIGVYESREFVVALGGHIDVNSEVGQGTTFRLTLPLAAGATVASPAHPTGIMETAS